MALLVLFAHCYPQVRRHERSGVLQQCRAWDGVLGKRILISHSSVHPSLEHSERTVCPLGLITRGLSGRSLQTQQSEKYAQSYLVQNLGTSQISVLMQKRHSLLAFSQGLGQTFHFTCSLPFAGARFQSKPL